MLRENFTFLHPDEVIVYLQQIIDNSMRMNDIIESLLLLVVVRGALAVEIGPVNMQSIVAEAISRVEFMLVERNATVHIPDDWPLTMGYGPWLEEVWYNYIINALKYGGDPGDYVRIRSPRWLLRFWLIDNGPVFPTIRHIYSNQCCAPCAARDARDMAWVSPLSNGL